MQPNEELFTRQQPTDRFREQTDPVLQLEEINVNFDGFQALTNLSLQIGVGELRCVIGPNGAGKTTSFYMVAGLVRPDEGRVIFADEDITELPMNLRARRGMGYLPQEESIFRKLSVEDNLLAILQTRKDMTSRQQKDRAVELMDRFGMHVLFPYAAVFTTLAFVTMLFVRHGDSKPQAKIGLEALDEMED